MFACGGKKLKINITNIKIIRLSLTHTHTLSYYPCDALPQLLIKLINVMPTPKSIHNLNLSNL